MFVSKNVPSIKNTLGPDIFKVNLTKEILVILKLFHQIKESILPNTLTIRIIILKSVKNIKREKHEPIIPMNIQTHTNKFLTKF